MSTPALFFHGIDSETGDYARRPASPDDVAIMAARGKTFDPENVEDARIWLKRGRKPRGLRSGDPCDLGQAGWGVIFTGADEQSSAPVREALRPLLDLRRSQAGREREHYYRELFGKHGYRAGDTKRGYLARHGVGPGAADPNRMPYYLLIVGDPATIPWEFQYQLDMQYAVGRIWFETLEEYEHYARAVVAAETARRDLKKRIAFFAPRNPDDEPTALSVDHLATPLATRAAEKHQAWEVTTALAEAATKARLANLLGGEETPDLLFTASHAVVYRSGNPRQLAVQGSLVCQDWPGVKGWKGPIPPEFYFSADDVNGSHRLAGAITFHFACYSAGGPAWSDFSTARERTPVAPHPFVALLPQRLLQRGALAVIGHVETAWQCSIDWPGAGPYIPAFEDALDRLMMGNPVGLAMEPFGQRYAELSSDLATVLEEERRGEAVDEKVLGGVWTQSHDSRNYVVLGDPAVRLPVAKEVS